MLKRAVQILGLAIFLIGCSSSQKKDTLTVGLQSGYPPYEYIENQGKIVGFDVDVAEQIANALHKKLIIREMGFDSLILALKNHKIDLILSGMSITNDRLKAIDMVPYSGDQVTHLQLLFWDSKGGDIETLIGQKIAVQAGTFQEEVLHHYAQIEPKSFENTQELVMDIKYGKSEAALVEPIVGNEMIRRFPAIHSVTLSLAPEDQVLGNGIGIAKDNPSLKAEVERVVQQLKETAQMKQLEKKWFQYD